MRHIPKILSLLVLWGAVGAIIVYVDPELLRDVIIPGAYLPFFAIVSLATWYTLWILLKSGLKSLLVAATLILALALNVARVMHLGLAIVLLLTLVIESWYIYHSYEKIHPTNERKDRVPGL